tara:strand:+ start:197 stop:877 length:681 start_codon:yes stop_codon:yes gene_type:complete
MITSINQPHYIPYIGYFSMIYKVNNFIFHDDVDYIKGEWKNRNKIRQNKNSENFTYLTVPIKKQEEKKLNKLLISYDKDWVNDHQNKIKNSYYGEKYYKVVDNLFNSVVENKPKYLSQLNINLILKILDYLEINTKIYYSSDFKSDLKKTDKIIYLCKEIGTSEYISNNKSSKYLEENKFFENSIKLNYQNYKHPIYSQNKNNFLSNLSIIDLIVYYGKESKSYLK